SAIRRRWCAISTAKRERRRRSTRWWRTCRCWAPWWISSSTTKKRIFAEKADDESNPDCTEFHIGFRHQLLDADVRRHLCRHRDLCALAPQPGGLRRRVENAAARGLTNHGRR